MRRRRPSCWAPLPHSCRFSSRVLSASPTKNRTLRSSDANLDPTGQIAASFLRRMELLSRAIYFGVLSALVTAGLLIGAFFAALIGIGHGQVVAILFALALMLLMASLVELTREMRVYVAYMHLE